MKRYIKAVFHFVQRMLLNYRFLSNHFAKNYIKRNNCPELTKEEKKEIDMWWEKFGVRFPNYDFFTMYYRVTGIKDPRFIPEPFMQYVITPHYNDRKRATAYADKSKFPVLMPNMRFPKMIAYRMDGHFYNASGEYLGETASDSIISFILDSIRQEGQNSIIIKESADTSCGLGVKKYFINSAEQLKAILEKTESFNFVIQFAVKQHPFFAQFNPDSVNIIRVNSWRHGDRVDFLASAVRFGMKGSHTDVSFVNGKEIIRCVGIDKNGVVRESGIDYEGRSIELNLSERKIPKWETVKALVRDNHLRMPFFDFIAWDITVDEDENVICIEYNILDPGSVVYQYADGPLAGEYTEEFLSFLLNENAQKELLPTCVRKRENRDEIKKSSRSL